MFETVLQDQMHSLGEHAMLRDAPPPGYWWAAVGEEVVAVHDADGNLASVHRGMLGTPTHAHPIGAPLRMVAAHAALDAETITRLTGHDLEAIRARWLESSAVIVGRR